MKRLLISICLLWGIQMPCSAAPATSGMQQAVQEAMQRIDAAERTAQRTQSLEALNAAACEQVIGELGLKGKQREQFAALYNAYRQELARTLDPAAGSTELDEAGQRAALKARLDNIAATAQVKRDYVDKFAAILTAEQIRRLYNTEGAIGTRIKSTAAKRRRSENRVKGSGNLVSQSFGTVGDYTALEVSNDITVTISPTAQQIVVTADDNLIDWVTIDRKGSTLSVGFTPEARSITDAHITAVVPASVALDRLAASSYGSIVCTMPLNRPALRIRIASGGSVQTDVTAEGLELDVTSYGKFDGNVQAQRCTVRVGSGGTVHGTIRCSGECSADLQSYGQFKGDARAAVLTLETGGGATWNGTMHADELHLTATSYGKIVGGIEGGAVTLSAASGGSIGGPFSGREFTASAVSYGKIDLRGKAVVQEGCVTVQSGGDFLAPDLSVARYRVSAASYGKAEVRCTGTLNAETSSGGKIGYAGECRVEARNPDVVRRH